MYKGLIRFPIVFLCVLSMGLASLSGNAAQDIMLQVPVRVSVDSSGQPGGKHFMAGLKAADFFLNINGQSRNIADFTALERSITTTPPTPGQGRTIALSFDVSNQYSGVSGGLIDGVTGFISQHLTTNDTLLLRTPLDVYSFKGKKGKDRIIAHVQTILKNDLLQQKREKQAAIDRLNKLIRDTEQKLDRKKMGIRSAMLFANHFFEEWRQFYKRFLMANLEHFSGMTERTAGFKGDKWLIHFQERTTLPMWVNFQRIKKKLNGFAARMLKKSSGGRILKETLEKIDRSMSFRGDFPMDELMNSLLGVNLGCNMVFLSGSEGQAGETGFSPDYETILSLIARRTGGTAVIAYENQLDQALEKVAAHKDYYYRLVFAFNGKAADKNLKIGVNRPGARAFYKKTFKAAEFQWLMKHLGNTEFKMDNYSLKGHTLGFTVYGSGVMEVEVRLIDSNGAAIYRTAKTLNSTGPSTAISLQLPQEHRGYFKLSVTVKDKRTQKTTGMNQYVKL